MKIKIKHDYNSLLQQGLPRHEASRLAGKVVEADESNFYPYAVPSIGRTGPNAGHPWLFAASEADLVEDSAVALDLTKPVQTRDGRPVEIKYVDESLEYAVNGIMADALGNRSPRNWRANGRVHSDGESPLDLIQAPEPLIEGWLNLYDTRPIAQQVGNTIHPTKEEADEWADADRTACIKVSYRKGEGL